MEHVETNDKAVGRNWRVVRAIDIPLGPRGDYQPSQQIIWQPYTMFKRDFFSIMEDVTVLVVGDTTELDRYAHLASEQSGNFAYYLEVRRWWQWHKVSDLTNMLATAHDTRQIRR